MKSPRVGERQLGCLEWEEVSALISADAILEANAALIVGMIFLATLREALGLLMTFRFLAFLMLSTVIFASDAALLVFSTTEDEIT